MQQVAARAVGARERLVVVRAERLQRDGHRLLQGRRRADREEIVHLADRIGRAPRRDDRPDAPACHAECLRRATDGDGALAHPGQRRHRDVLPVVVDVLVDLVGHRVGVVSAAQLGDRLEVPARQHAPRRVVRRADDDRAGALRERRPESVDVELCARGDRHEDRFRAAQDRVGPVVLVERLEHDHLVARIDDGEQG